MDAHSLSLSTTHIPTLSLLLLWMTTRLSVYWSKMSVTLDNTVAFQWSVAIGKGVQSAGFNYLGDGRNYARDHDSYAHKHFNYSCAHLSHPHGHFNSSHGDFYYPLRPFELFL